MPALPCLLTVDDNSIHFLLSHHLLSQQPLLDVLALVSLQLDNLSHLIVLCDAAVRVDCRCEGRKGRAQKAGAEGREEGL
jgi:hypothetical protein